MTYLQILGAVMVGGVIWFILYAFIFRLMNKEEGQGFAMVVSFIFILGLLLLLTN